MRGGCQTEHEQRGVGIAEAGNTTAPVAFVAVSGTLLNGDLLTITSVQDPIGGTATLMSTHVVFVPDPDLNGSAQFAYVACDPGNLCAPATVMLTFAPIDDAPRPVDDDYAVGFVTSEPPPVADPSGGNRSGARGRRATGRSGRCPG